MPRSRSLKWADVSLEKEKYPEFRRQLVQHFRLVRTAKFNNHIDFKGTGIG
jgi:hypothetical protein